jgi:hypothetical protein
MSLNEQQLAKLNKVQLDESWKYGLSEFLLSPKMDELKAFLVEEKKADGMIERIKEILNHTFKQTKVIDHLTMI